MVHNSIISFYYKKLGRFDIHSIKPNIERHKRMPDNYVHSFYIFWQLSDSALDAQRIVQFCCHLCKRSYLSYVLSICYDEMG